MNKLDSSEFSKAKAWRLRNEMNPAQLGESIGWSQESVYLFEKGQLPKGRAGGIKPWTWLRYKRACGDLDAELNGRKRGKVFEW